MKSKSDQAALAELLSRPQDLSALDRYKACVALANNGQSDLCEIELSPHERVLLEARRKLHRAELRAAQGALEGLNENDLTALLAGDRLFVLAHVHHRQGEVHAAIACLDQAVEFFRAAGDSHRELRSSVNRLICESDIESCSVGRLFVLEQRAMRDDHFDIASLIQRTRAIEFLRTGLLNEALIAARSAVHSNTLDGCAEDRLIAVALLALIEALLGNLTEAHELRNSVYPVGPRVANYILCYEAIIAGRIPSVPHGHALETIPWKKIILKPQSVPGKILAALKARALTRDQLIETVWGAGADHPSYRGRLYTAINAVRKAGQGDIYFDGENYRLK